MVNQWAVITAAKLSLTMCQENAIYFPKSATCCSHLTKVVSGFTSNSSFDGYSKLIGKEDCAPTVPS